MGLEGEGRVPGAHTAAGPGPHLRGRLERREQVRSRVIHLRADLHETLGAVTGIDDGHV